MLPTIPEWPAGGGLERSATALPGLALVVGPFRECAYNTVVPHACVPGWENV